MPIDEIDDTLSSVKYFGSWWTSGNGFEFQSTTHFTKNVGAQLSVTLKGFLSRFTVLLPQSGTSLVQHQHTRSMAQASRHIIHLLSSRLDTTRNSSSRQLYQTGDTRCSLPLYLKISLSMWTPS